MEKAPNASMITLLVQRLRDTGSVVDRKPSGRVFIMKTKVADVETALQRSQLKRLPVYINIITKFIYLMKVMKCTLGCRKTVKFITHYGTWCKRFRVGRESTEDDQRPARLVTVSGVETVTKINQIVRADRRMSIRMIVEAENTDKETVR
ncbi:DUF4817 domain-containing protein [Trichonephila clavipes]|uniref:DUF4817 domain-containing protein n=1 Tax=Trichonephila clavipes TaxID=2585209 RepID=A0A8X6RFH5_TRICX|nr:DUF4817 domain-containing protein [Trichonephila clavipes]